MRTALRALRPLRIAVFVGVLATGVLVAPQLCPLGRPSVAHADPDPPMKIGTQLVARADCELQKVVITRGARLEITGSSPSTVDVALPDGYVLRRVSLSRIKYFFDVVR